jgi:hypothetical protein
MYSDTLTEIVEQAISRLDEDLLATLPHSATEVIAWTRNLSRSGDRRGYFQHPIAFPSLLLPWWGMECILNGNQPDLPLQTQLVYSTINGYYYIRMVDNVMDGQATTEVQLLPALNFFHTRFQNSYLKMFPANHPFWRFFEATWFQSADVAMADATLNFIDPDTFDKISARKICAAKIPVAAVCYTYDRPDWITLWSKFIDDLGGWHQLLNDIFDWRKDAEQGRVTYFLSQYQERKEDHEALVTWISREGFNWGIEALRTRMVVLRQDAVRLECPPLVNYLDRRQALVEQRVASLRPGLKVINRLLEM